MKKFLLKYLGTWFEIRRYEAANQTDFDCVMARYTLNADGSVEVANSGYFNGQFIEFIGRAEVAFPDQVPLPAKLDVTFAPGRKKGKALINLKLTIFHSQNQARSTG